MARYATRSIRTRDSKPAFDTTRFHVAAFDEREETFYPIDTPPPEFGSTANCHQIPVINSRILGIAAFSTLLSTLTEGNVVVP